MSALKTKVGTSSGIFRDEITHDRIAHFSHAIVRQAIPENQQETLTAPPIFLTVLRRGEFSLFQQLGCALANVLHTGQEYQYENPICAGDVVCFESVLTHVLEKKRDSFVMQFLTFETTYTAERKSEKLRIGKAKTTVLVREPV